MRVVKIENVNFNEITEILDNSGLVIYPTETCYGIGCNPCDPIAVEKLMRYKARREGKAISVAVSDAKMASEYVELNETAKRIYERFLPGPFTVISKSKGFVAKGIESENGTLGIRIPDFPWMIELLREYKKPITATSANQSYQKVPYSISDIIENATDKALKLVDLIIDAGELPHKSPSTVLDTTLGDIQVVRKGEFIPDNSIVSEFISRSESETIEFGKELLKKFIANLEFRPLLIALQGDLGAGKTQFTKGVAVELGIKKPILSPTFILSKEYDTPLGNRLYHIDTWRLENLIDAKELRINNMLSIQSSMNNVVVIEWADKIVEYLQELNVNVKIIWVEMIYDKNDENTRLIRWSE